MAANLILPEKVRILVTDADGGAVEIPNLLFRIHAFARRKNDFLLQPFATNSNGIADVSGQELLAEVNAHFDSGLMDYCPILECNEKVEISLLSKDDIHHAIYSRTHIWKTLLAGERDRWNSLEHLIALYRSAANSKVQAAPITMKWNGSQPEYIVRVVAKPVL